MTPRVSRILETALYVADLERSKAFYTELFGFEPFLEDGRGWSALGVPGEGVLLLFRQGGSTSRARPRAG